MKQLTKKDYKHNKTTKTLTISNTKTIRNVIRIVVAPKQVAIMIGKGGVNTKNIKTKFIDTKTGEFI